MTERSNEQTLSESGEKRVQGLRLRKYIDVVVEDRLTSMLFRASIADISETGMRVVADQYLPKGSRYTFTMKRTPFLEVRGEVRWVKTLDTNTFQMGVLFVDLSVEDTARLANFLELERKRLTSTSG
jgi:hypothetical protein